MALRAARNAGFAVPKATVDKCIEYVKGCQDRATAASATWRRAAAAAAFARTAAGVVALYSAGIYKGPEVETRPAST